MDERQRLLAYLSTLYPSLDPRLSEIRKKALENEVPIIRDDTRNFLGVLLSMKQPKHILEVGTAVGFSAIYMALHTSEQCRIDTLESYGKRIPVAHENIRSFGLEQRIFLTQGDAAETIPTLTGPFDFVFVDAAKGQYGQYFSLIRPMLTKDAVVVFDNVLQDMDIIESHYAVVRRNRTIHKRMRQFLRELTSDPEFHTDILAVGDGLAVCVRDVPEKHD